MMQHTAKQNTRYTDFYRATHMHIAVYVIVRCLSVCLSVTPWIVSKRQNSSLHN